MCVLFILKSEHVIKQSFFLLVFLPYFGAFKYTHAILSPSINIHSIAKKHVNLMYKYNIIIYLKVDEKEAE